MKAKDVKGLVLFTLLLSVVSLFIEQSEFAQQFFLVSNILDFVILALLFLEVYRDYQSAKLKWIYLRRNLPSLLFLLLFCLLFIYNKLLLFRGDSAAMGELSLGVVILRNTFILLKVFGRLRKLSNFVESITLHPAQTILFSFLLVILSGTLYLMAPFSTIEPGGLPFLDALFTSTSAVCVTGLIVVDTATVFSFWGHVGILLLIQIGGLSIMIISYFTLFLFRRRISLEERLLISYLLSERDMGKLSKNLRIIIASSLIIEAVGALLLFLPMRSAEAASPLFFSIFHAVSAFCNAGFSLFSDSLVRFRGDLLVNAVVAILIILGGISFAVISDLHRLFVSLFRGARRRLSRKGRRFGELASLSLNSRLVLIGTAVLLLSSAYLIYGMEHSGVLADLPTPVQYLSAFFQAVSLRTAGFNTLDFSAMRGATLLLMLLFMFVGAASGSTAGGIKINNMAIILAYVRSVLRGGGQATIMKRSVESEQINSAFLVLLFGISAVFFGTLSLRIVETAPLEELLFEACSAFATVGLSSGLTASLSGLGKWTLIVLMFIGRLGPLTILAAVSREGKRSAVAYPSGSIST